MDTGSCECSTTPPMASHASLGPTRRRHHACSSVSTRPGARASIGPRGFVTGSRRVKSSPSQRVSRRSVPPNLPNSVLIRDVRCLRRGLDVVWGGTVGDEPVVGRYGNGSEKRAPWRIVESEGLTGAEAGGRVTYRAGKTAILKRCLETHGGRSGSLGGQSVSPVSRFDALESAPSVSSSRWSRTPLAVPRPFNTDNSPESNRRLEMAF